MLPVVTADEMRALDGATIARLGIPGFTLMETAGRAVAAAALAMLGSARASVVVVCGPGNNGGDGYVVARVLRARSVDATVVLTAPREKVQGDARAHLATYEAAGGAVVEVATAPDVRGTSSSARAVTIAEAAALVGAADLVIDALFGIGPVRPLTGDLATIVHAINRAPQILAVDIPSGLDADTGASAGASVRATRTIAMAAHKVAHVSSPGFAACGEVEVAEIGIPVANAHAGLVERADVVRWLPRPTPLDHKGKRGHVLVVSGAPEMRGAGRLSALGALRAGAGLVTLAGDGEVDAPDSVMTTHFTPDALQDVVVIGPGLGQRDEARARVAAVLASGVPAVLDADALNLVTPALLAAAVGPVVITPHPGEAARLLGISTQDIERDRMAAVRTLARATRVVVVLKGARTLICDGTRDATEPAFVAINPTGSPALATAGSGDVLAGVIGALLAQDVAGGGGQHGAAGSAAFVAACAGSYVHGAAGATLAQAYGRGRISSDLPEAIAREIAALTELQVPAVNGR